MKRLFTLLVALITAFSVFAQAPQKMSYQAVVRNPSGTLVTNQSVGMRISIMQGSPNGTIVYREVYNPNPQANANGLVTIVIGEGTPTVGTFSSIDWAGGPYYLMTETDPSGGSTYTITGTTQLMSVPYALYANSVAGYSESDPVFGASPSHGITSGNISNWNTAYGWGNHAGLYKPLNWVPSWSDVTGKPAFAPVATSGDYDDLINKPLFPMPGGATGNVQFNNDGVLGGEPEFTWNINAKRLGIGTDAPDYQLDVIGNQFRTINAETSHATGAAVFGTGKDPGGKNAGVRGQSYSTMGYGLYGDVLATSGVNYGVYGKVESPQGYSGYFTGGRFYIEGNTGIGTINPEYKLDVTGNLNIINGRYGDALWCNGSQALWWNGTYFSWGYSSTYNYFARPITIGNVTEPTGYALWVQGNAWSTGAFLSSDARYKKNISEIENALDKIMKIRGTSFVFRTDEFKDYQFAEGLQFGFIAQELEKVFPEMVKTEGNGYKSVNYNEMIPVLVEALKEQQKQIEELKKEIALLKAR